MKVCTTHNLLASLSSVGSLSDSYLAISPAAVNITCWARNLLHHQQSSLSSPVRSPWRGLSGEYCRL
jgi:hypothetical protein